MTTKTNDKRTNTLANKRQAVLTALAVEYKPEITSDDLFNIEVDLGSAIARTDYRIKSLKDKIDAVDRQLQAIVDSTGGSRGLTSEKAMMQNLEVLGNQLKRHENTRANYEYSLELLTIKRLAQTDFYKQTLSKVYIPYSSKAKDVEKSKSERQYAIQWLKENGHELEPVIK